MDVKLALFCVLLLVFAMQLQVEAVFLYNRYHPDPLEQEKLGLKCQPGRTIMKVQQPPPPVDDEEYEDERRSHMSWATTDPSCQICVCSIEGKDEYCSKRPAMNVNECMRMASLMDRFKSMPPYSHDRTLSYMIRRDYLWHNDEIPYEPKARCTRGHSYYTNNKNANITDIDVASDIDSLLDYPSQDVCYFCICHTTGVDIGCIKRNPWYCEYYRLRRDESFMRDSYRVLFQQDRPAYFRQLSWRLRRTMDSGMFDMLETVGGDDQAQSCIPFVSEYTDCNEENICDGCTKCSCSAEARWTCEDIRKCDEDTDGIIEFNDIDSAFDTILQELKQNGQNIKSLNQLVQPADEPEELLLAQKDLEIDDELLSLMRSKRAIQDKIDKNNGTVKFYHAKDEINEDTLRNNKSLGTITVKKFDMLPQISRRTDQNNTRNSMQIEYAAPKIYHINDNKIDIPQHVDKEDAIVSQKVSKFLGNYTQEIKNKNLSATVVSELTGDEVIGDHNAPVISNITFQQENDTATAMALIAGNLLNKLWNMEKDEARDAIDIEVIRHEKIADLLELFKEPLNLKQQVFLKNALQQLSSALDKNKEIENVSLCENVEKVKKAISDGKSLKDCDKTKKGTDNDTKSTTVKKLKNILDLVEKFENVESKLSDVGSNKDKNLTETEQSFLNDYGRILETITNLLVPKNKGKKVLTGLRDINQFNTDDFVRGKLKELYNIDLGDLDLATKDKIVLDYLAHIQSRPDCLLKRPKTYTLPDISGNIFANLAEFLKVKTAADLFNLFGIENKVALKSREPITTTEIEKVITTTEPIEIIKKDNKTKFDETKAKLKTHLKSILEDLLQLQSIEGKSGDIKVSDALPCIYKLLENSKQINKKQVPTLEQTPHLKTSRLIKVNKILSNLKVDLKFTPTRRTDSTGPRPKSAAIWERIVRKFLSLGKTRRSSAVPKSFEEIRKIIDKVESTGSNTYKNYAYLYEVPAADRLLLLKTFDTDTKKYIEALKTIKTTLNSQKSGTPEDFQEIRNFLDNVATNINVNEKVVKNLDKPKQLISKNVYHNPKTRFSKVMRPREPEMQYNDNVKLTRNQIINQLIKRRVEQYFKAKESKINDMESINYNIAKKILMNMETGNTELARELFKIFVSGNKTFIDYTKGKVSSKTYDVNEDSTIFNQKQLQKVPLIQFEEPDDRLSNKDQIIKQLLGNVRNMKL